MQCDICGLRVPEKPEGQKGRPAERHPDCQETSKLFSRLENGLSETTVDAAAVPYIRRRLTGIVNLFNSKKIEVREASAQKNKAKGQMMKDAAPDGSCGLCWLPLPPSPGGRGRRAEYHQECQTRIVKPLSMLENYVARLNPTESAVKAIQGRLYSMANLMNGRKASGK